MVKLVIAIILAAIRSLPHRRSTKLHNLKTYPILLHIYPSGSGIVRAPPQH